MRRPAPALRAGRPAALAFAACAALSPAAFAQQDGFMQQLNDIRDAAGFGKTRPPIDFAERPPLVVPPTYTLPPPGTGSEMRLGINDPDVVARSKALVDPRRPVPPIDPGASASGLDSRHYLVDPPSGLRDPARVAAEITTDTTSAAATKSRTGGHHHHAHRSASTVGAAQ